MTVDDAQFWVETFVGRGCHAEVQEATTPAGVTFRAVGVQLPGRRSLHWCYRSADCMDVHLIIDRHVDVGA
jgi:hypothetical protein